MADLFDWSTTADSNTTVDGTNIAEACAAGNLNNGLRSVMALVRNSFATALKTFLNGTAPLPIANGGTAATTASAARTALGLGTAAVLSTDDVDERARDAVGTAITAGTGITKTVSDAGDTITLAIDTIGISQTWQNVAGSRSAGVSYQNSTGKPIMVSVQITGGTGYTFQVSSNGSTWVTIGHSEYWGRFQVIIPNGHYYRATSGSGIDYWTELR